MNSLLMQLQEAIIRTALKLTDAIFEADNRCASGLVKEKLREAITELGWAANVLKQLTLLANSPLFRHSIAEAERFGRDN